jgi:arylsulfatase A-like enzyme
VAEEPYFSLHDRALVKKPLPIPHGKRRTYGDIMREVRHAGRLNEADFREIRAVYYGMISRVDAQLQLLLDALHEHNLEDDTAVIYFSDHGDYAGDYGMVEKFNSAFEESLIHVPLVMRVPGMTSGETSHQLVEMTDLYATVMDLAHLKPKHDHFSQSLVPLLRGEELPPRDAVFCEAGFNSDETQTLPPLPAGSIYEASIKAFATPQILSRVMMVRDQTHKYIYSPGDCDELYNLHEDPGELHNLAGDSAQQETINRLRERLLRWMLDTSDVLPHQPDPRGWKG